MEIYSVCSFPPPHYFLPFLTLPPFWALLLPSPIQSGFACKVKMDPVSIFKKRWFHSNSKARSFPEKQKALQVFCSYFWAVRPPPARRLAERWFVQDMEVQLQTSFMRFAEEKKLFSLWEIVSLSIVLSPLLRRGVHVCTILHRVVGGPHAIA